MPPSVPSVPAVRFDPQAAAAILRHCDTLAARTGDALLAYLIAMALIHAENLQRDQSRGSRRPA